MRPISLVVGVFLFVLVNACQSVDITSDPDTKTVVTVSAGNTGAPERDDAPGISPVITSDPITADMSVDGVSCYYTQWPKSGAGYACFDEFLHLGLPPGCPAAVPEKCGGYSPCNYCYPCPSGLRHLERLPEPYLCVTAECVQAVDELSCRAEVVDFGKPSVGESSVARK